MHLPEFIKDYFDDRQELFDEIKTLEKSIGIRLFKRLLNDNNEINFYSWLTEVRFGLYFDKISSELKHEELIDDKTPDWTFIKNNQKILVEVARLNPNEKEFLQRIKLENSISKILREHPDAQVGTIPSIGGPKWSSAEYFGNAKSKLAKKEKDYRDIIESHKIPFIICIAPSSDTNIMPLNVFEFLIGNVRSGFFYTDKDFGKNVTGVLLRPFIRMNEIYFHNENAENKLNAVNEEFFEGISYKGD